MVIIISTGGGLAAFAAVVKGAVSAVTAAQAAVAAAAVQVATATAAAEAALAAAVAAEAAGALVAAEAALAAAIAAEAAAATAAGVAAANSWNPVGWAIGAVLVGAADQDSGDVVTWGCYKPIIGEVDSGNEPTLPITLADLAAHPEVVRVSVADIASCANLPNVQIENKASHVYLLHAVMLPGNHVAYHAERVDKWE